MEKVVFLCCLLFSQTGFAETISAKIFGLEKVQNKRMIVKFDNGRVAWSDESLDLVPGQTLRAVIDEKNKLSSFSVDKDFIDEDAPVMKILTAERPEFTPTVLNGYSEVEAMFNRLNPKFTRLSECSDRAHVWAFDEFKNRGISTEKVFIFFTASYINRNNFKWWFHVAPLVTVNEGGTLVKRVLDYRYTDGPKLIKEWSDSMVFSHRDCKMTTKFSEYDVNPQTEDCYMMIDSMYYRLPGDLSNQETLGVYETSFNSVEVAGARSRAFRKGDL